MDLNLSNKEEMESSDEDYKDPEPTRIGKITHNNESTLLGEPKSFSGKEEDAMRWLMAMKAYFKIINDFYDEEKKIVLVFLNKMTKRRAGTFAEGWYLRLINLDIPDSEKTFNKLCTAFEETFILKHIKDQAQQDTYSLSMR